MPDITMCTNKKCPSNDSCYRSTAEPNEHRQAFADFKPQKNHLYCAYYWPSNNKEEK